MLARERRLFATSARPHRHGCSTFAMTYPAYVLPIDLLIVGAGPVGLSMAVAATHRGAKRVLIVEQARSLRPVGRSIDLLPNATRTLFALAPTVRKNLEPYITIPPPGKIRGVKVSTDGSLLCEMRPEGVGDLATVEWWQLQRLLMESLPPNDKILVLNHQLVNVIHEEDTGLVTAEFIVGQSRENPFKNWDADYSTEKDELSEYEMPMEEAHAKYFQSCDENGSDPKRVSCRAKVLFGADGINSIARRSIYRDSGPGWEKFAEPKFTGYVSVRALGIPKWTAADERKVREVYFKNAVISAVTRLKEYVSPLSPRGFFVLLKRGEAPLLVLASLCFTIDDDTLARSSPLELVEIAKEKAKEISFSDPLQRLCSQLWDDAQERIQTRPYYVVPATHPPSYEALPDLEKVEYPEGFRRPWYYKRAVLAGDAAHGGPDFLAQGSAMGIEDAFELAVRLDAAGLWSDDNESGPSEEVLGRAFEDYYQSRLDRVRFLQGIVMNRLSEYEIDAIQKNNDRLWRYNPSDILSEVELQNYR